MGRVKRNKEEIAEDYCFACKDGGHLRVCDFKSCLKAYHPQCVGKESSFLETDEQWNCGWHSCFICKRSSFVQCFCCPSSVCRKCIREVEFVQAKKKTKGFCNNCLRLTILIEKNVDVDSDGGKVDFKDSETYEFLFKDYWAIVKDKEHLSLTDLQVANALLKGGKSYTSESDSDRCSVEQQTYEDDDLQDNSDDETSFLANLKRKKRRKVKAPIKRCKSKKKTYVGWGSEELIGFLSSIGKDTKEPITQLDASEIVKDYIQSNNLLHTNKKKKNVICDERLLSLFRRKKLKLHKIYSLLESHFAANGDSDDEISLSSEEEDNMVLREKKRNISSEFKVKKSNSNYYREKFLGSMKSSSASIIEENIKLVYLKRSLVIDLLKYPENFEQKVVGCFVRVKRDPKDFYNMPQKVYQLGQVNGIKKVTETYKIGELKTDVVLCISNMVKDVQISMLSDDDFEEEECEDLRQLVKEGLLERPTVGQLEEKAKSVHADIISHWIDRELVRLQRLIDQANEKGWRRELYECIDKRELLRTPEERQRLLKEIPKVIADIEGEIRDTTCSSEDHEENGNVTNVNSPQKVSAVKRADSGENAAAEGPEETNPRNSSLCNENCDDRHKVIEIAGSKENPKRNKARKALAVDLAEDDDSLITLEKSKPSTTFKVISNQVICESDTVWHYIDPQGKGQGPFSMAMLREWKEGGFFDSNFKVWRTGQSPENSILLRDALRLTIKIVD
ncbi:uncharacterized protein At5g08430-like isoform X3 [Ananas comosus]|uniref:Uncharacterized protein At5g08430-like isoform X3 n=1 Tax=Ananas comosus TaxID=4615 RepID=A0A6P5FSN6_ANACO|nr:uncharacterized protein At5g08430-like isoform X3 [Ananas comosus]